MRRELAQLLSSSGANLLQGSCEILAAGAPMRQGLSQQCAAGSLVVPSLVADWNADQGVVSAASLVSSWTDATSNAYALAAAGTARPTRIANSLNGHAGLQGNTTSVSMSVAGVPLTQPFTVFLVGSFPAVAGTVVVFDSTDAVHLEEIAYTAAATEVYAGGSIVAGGGAPSGSPEIYATVVNGASSLIERNNVSIASGNPGPNNATGVTLFSMVGGASAWAPCTLNRVLVAGAGLTLAQRQSIVRSLGATYAIAVS